MDYIFGIWIINGEKIIIWTNLGKKLNENFLICEVCANMLEIQISIRNRIFSCYWMLYCIRYTQLGIRLDIFFHECSAAATSLIRKEHNFIRSSRLKKKHSKNPRKSLYKVGKRVQTIRLEYIYKSDAKKTKTHTYSHFCNKKHWTTICVSEFLCIRLYIDSRQIVCTICRLYKTNS